MYLGVEHLNLSKRKTGALAPVPALAGVDVVFLVLKVQELCQLVGHAPGPHEPADVLDRGHAVGARAMEPAFRVDLNDDRSVALQLHRAIVKVVLLRLCVLMPCDRLAVLIPCHVLLPLSFSYFVPPGTIIYYHNLYNMSTDIFRCRTPK